MDCNETAIIFLSSCIVGLSTSISSQKRSVVTFWVLLASAVFLAILAVYLLSLIATQRSKNASYKKKDEIKEEYDPPSSLVWKTRLIGIIASIYFFALPLYTPGGPYNEAIARAFFFAGACKTLDLTVARAHNPPIRIDGNKEIPILSWTRRGEYIYLLLRETRYNSFSIAMVEKDRISPANPLWTYGPGIVIPLLVYFFPCAETRFLLQLLGIQVGFELCHTVLHPSCQRPCFWQPFAASSASAFWRTHWQQDAASFLYSLAYAPVKSFFTRRFGRNVGRAAGVMAVFCLSGIWHGWAVAVLVTTPWRTAIGIWGLFMSQGVLCLLEKVVWGERQGGFVQRFVVWGFSVWSGGMWLRHVERHAVLGFVRWYVDGR